VFWDGAAANLVFGPACSLDCRLGLGLLGGVGEEHISHHLCGERLPFLNSQTGGSEIFWRQAEPDDQHAHRVAKLPRCLRSTPLRSTPLRSTPLGDLSVARLRQGGLEL